MIGNRFHRRCVLACLLGASFLVTSWSSAATVRRWSLASRNAFVGGTLEGTAIDGRGRLTLAPPVETLWGPESGIVWDLAAAGTNSAYVALSGPGRVIRVGAGDAPAEWYRGEEAQLVTSLAVARDGSVFAGVSPDGIVIRSTGVDSGETAIETGAKFVWALAAGDDDSLWIGTGVPGKLLRRDARGTLETVFESGDDPVRCLAVLPDGGVVLGTGGRGRVIRVDGQGRAFVVFDADQDEIVSVDVGPDGAIHALAAGSTTALRPANQASAPRTENNSVTVTARPPGGAAASTDAASPEDGKGDDDRGGATRKTSVGGALFRIGTDGDVRTIWETATDTPFDLLRVGSSRFRIATGDRGRIYEVVDEQDSVAVRIASEQASALARSADGRTLIGASGDARVSLVGLDPRPTGRYLAKPIDGGTVAAWGKVQWHADGDDRSGVQLSIRAGNSEEPDDTWTDWIELDDTGNGTKADVPATRWSQLRIDLVSRNGRVPALRRVELSYLPRNRPPAGSELIVETAGVVWSPGPDQSSASRGPVVADDPTARRAALSLRSGRAPAQPIRRSYEHGARTFRWDASDPDADRLLFELEIRREETDEWFPLVDSLELEFFSWDTRSMPDGIYRTRLTVSDRLDNPDGSGLDHRTVSEPFAIDNTRPMLSRDGVERDGDQVIVRFTAIDEGGRIEAVEASFEGGPWKIVAPADGVTDSSREEYRLPVGELSPGAQAKVRLRVTDAVGNQGGDLWSVDAP